MRWDSPIVLVVSGTIAVHTLFLTFIDAAIVTHPPPKHEVAKHIEYIKIIKEPPPLPKPIVQARAEPPPIKDTPKPRTRTTVREPVRQIQQPPQPPPTDVPPLPANVPTGGEPTVQMPDIAPSATGVPVAVGKRNTQIGRGGTGGGTGAGVGTGTADHAPPPVSVATIKQRALPKGDNSYFDAGKDYPAEARQLGIEGPIRVRLVVDDKGKVASAVLLNRLGHGLDELALDRAKKIEFDPAKDTDDKAVTSVVVWTFNMTLPK